MMEITQYPYRRSAVHATVLLLVAALAAASAQPPAPRDVEAFLRDQFGLTASSLRPLAQRRAHVRSLDARDGREVGALGVIHVRVPPAFYASLLREITTFKRGEEVLQIGRFASPAQASDVAALTLDEDDLRGLERCRLHHCDLQLPAAAIERFRREVRWGTPAATAQAEGLLREELTGLVNGYLVDGNRALVTYDDGKSPVSVAGEFERLMAADPAMQRRLPLLRDHLANFPRTRTAAVDDVIYWSKEQMGPAVVINVTHLAVTPMADAPVAFAAASKQLYSTHYFDASLGITLILADASNEAGLYLVYVSRSRIDVLQGWLAGVKRTVMKSRLRGAVERSLLQARDIAEREYHARSEPR